MKFRSMSEEEIKSSSLLDPGIYDFEVISATDKVSKKGNEMIELKLKIFGKDGKEYIVFDYLLESFAGKLRNFAYNVGLTDKYEAGELNSLDCLSRCGTVDIIVQEGNANPSGGYYPDKNSVLDYLPSARAAKYQKQEIDQDVPF